MIEIKSNNLACAEHVNFLKQKIESGTFNQPAISQYILTNTQNLENVFDIWFYLGSVALI